MVLTLDSVSWNQGTNYVNKSQGLIIMVCEVLHKVVNMINISRLYQHGEIQ